MRTIARMFRFGSALGFVGFTVLLGTASAQVQPTFSIPQVAVHPSTDPIVHADFDHDGFADIAVGNISEGLFGSPTFISVMLGNGTGLFPAPLDLPAATATIAGLVAADIDGDGNTDLCAVRYNYMAGIRALTTWRGDGLGGFSPPNDLTITSAPMSLAIADMNNDGLLDAVTGNQGSGANGILSVAFNQGNATFGPPVYYTGAAMGVSVAAADLDNDGLRDVGVLETTAYGTGSLSFSWVETRKNIGGGALGAATTLAVGSNERSLVFSDLDGDGDLDGTLVTSESSAGELRILRNDGTANFAIELHTYAGTGYGQAVDDLNLDGVLDLAVGGGNYIGVGVFYGPIAGGSANSVSHLVGQAVRGVTIVDTNNDGLKDVAASASGTVAILLASPAGDFLTDATYPTQTGSKRVAFGDLNGDGRADAVVTFAGSPFPIVIPGGLSVLLGTGAGAFGARTDFPSTSQGMSGVSLGDCDGDGLLDAIATNGTTGEAQFYKGNGSGALAAAPTFSTGTTPVDAVVADLSGDGILDIATANGAAGTVTFFLGNGAGGFGPAQPIAIGGNVLAIAVGDIDNDGRNDLVSANTGSLTISVIPASSTGGFQPKTDYPTPGAPVAVAVGDTNYDARLDVATACVSPYVISHRLNIGAGALGAATDYPTGGIPASVHYLDWNGDGWHDLASVTSSGTVVSMRLGDGSGAFGARNDFAGNPFGSGTIFGPSTSRISAVADLDADGRSDLAIVTNFVLATLLNRQAPALGTSLYGGGTPGCVGALGVSISAPPSVGTTIRFMPTNAPDRTFGLGVISTGQDVAGIDFFGIGMLCHVDFAALTLLAFDAPTDNAGTGFVGFMIPNNPALVGATGYFQSFFLTSVCKPSPFGLMSSRGLAFTIQP